MFPKTSRKKENNLETVNVQFLKENLQLIIDKEKCTGCGTCSRACPKEAIAKKVLDEPIRIAKKQVIRKIKHYLIPYVHNPGVCVYCGVCSYVCAFDALTLSVNGEIVKMEDLPLVVGKALPKLEAEEIELPNGKKSKKYTKGSVTINTELCAGGCTNCADACAEITQAIKAEVKEAENPWDAVITFEIFNDKCIQCGACHNACPTDALELTIDEVLSSGEYNSPFWDNIVDRIKLNERKE